MVENRKGYQPEAEAHKPRVFRTTPEHADADTQKMYERINHDDYADEVAEKDFYDAAILLPDEALPTEIERILSREGQDFSQPDLDLDEYADQIAETPALASEASPWHQLVVLKNAQDNQQTQIHN